MQMGLLIIGFVASIFIAPNMNGSVGFYLPRTATAPSGQQDSTANPGASEEVNQLNASVVKLYREGKFKEALPLAKRVLEITQKTFGAEHQSTLAAITNLAEMHFALKEYKEAEPLYQRSLIIAEKAFGTDHRELLKYLGRLALLRYLRKDYVESEALYQRVVAINEKVFGAKSIEVAQPLEWLALFYVARGDTKQSGRTYSRLASVLENLPEDIFSKLSEKMVRYACLREKQKTVGNLYDGIPDESEGGKALYLERPAYPNEAKRNLAQGTVLVRILIDEEGKAIQACAMNGPEVLARAAIGAALRARYEPTVISGKPMKIKGVITFNFEIRL
jgi:TonB family protein